MAKPKLKRVTRKRREKKLVERGAAHIRSSFKAEKGYPQAPREEARGARRGPYSLFFQ